MGGPYRPGSHCCNGVWVSFQWASTLSATKGADALELTTRGPQIAEIGPRATQLSRRGVVAQSLAHGFGPLFNRIENKFGSLR